MLAVRTMPMPSEWVLACWVTTHTIPTLGGIFHYRSCRHRPAAVLPRQFSISRLVKHRILDKSGTRTIGLLSLDEVPHLIQLDLRNAKLSQEMLIDLSSFARSPSEPIQNGFFGHSEHEANTGKINSNQQHLQSHHD